jgi:hypothetical protein
MGKNIKKPDDVMVKEKGNPDLERALAAEDVSNEKEKELVAIITSASAQLPFSKARSVALIATVAAAPFLSVRYFITYMCIWV